MRIEADLRDFGLLAELWQREPTITRQEMLVAMTDADLLLKGELMQALPAGAGGAAGLRGSVFTEEFPLADNVIGLVATNVTYAPHVEFGTKPHMPPLQPIMDWLAAKVGSSGKELRDHAERIAWSIYAHGTKANPVWATTFNRLTGEIRRKIEASVQRIIARLAGAKK